MSSYCPIHGEYSIRIAKDSNDKFDMNVPLRYLVKILYLLELNKTNNMLNVIVDGGDWSGMWPLRVYMEPLLKLGYTDVPSIIYTPTILDWSGSKLSKRMYVGNQAYREYYKEGLPFGVRKMQNSEEIPLKWKQSLWTIFTNLC